MDSGLISFGNLFGSAKPSGRNDVKRVFLTFCETIKKGKIFFRESRSQKSETGKR
jgi:hypothetical protein